MEWYSLRKFINYIPYAFHHLPNSYLPHTFHYISDTFHYISDTFHHLPNSCLPYTLNYIPYAFLHDASNEYDSMLASWRKLDRRGLQLSRKHLCSKNLLRLLSKTIRFVVSPTP